MSIPMIGTKTYRRNRARAGTASIEFAIVAPILFAMLVGAVDYGLFVAQSSWLIASTRVGLEYVRVSNCVATGACSNGPQSFVNYYTVIPTITPHIVATTTAAYCTCAGNSPTAVGSAVTPCPPTGTVSPCNGNPDARVFVYARMSTFEKGAYKPLFSSEFFGGGTATAQTIRTQ
jgi:Flp pilus assembly protein TadG